LPFSTKATAVEIKPASLHASLSKLGKRNADESD